MVNYPRNTHVALKWNEIIRKEKCPDLSKRFSSRMVKMAAHLPENEFIGWQIHVPTEGLARFESFGSAIVRTTDLEWIVEEYAKTTVEEQSALQDDGSAEQESWYLYEMQLRLMQPSGSIGFGMSPDIANLDSRRTNTLRSVWPMRFFQQFDELIRVFRDTGAWLRYTVGQASLEEQRKCEQSVLSTWAEGEIKVSEYIGKPVRTRVLLLLPDRPTIRLCTTIDEMAPGIDVELSCVGNMAHDDCRQIWENPMQDVCVLPDLAARILAIDPIITGNRPVVGVASCAEEAMTIPAGHHNSSDKQALRIGIALGTSGIMRDITIGDADLRRHWQIVGQTGTGKSTLLADVLLEAIYSGRGITFFDPHGSTIDVILRSVPKEHAHRIRVAHLGDADNPVPINMWESNRPDDAERTISDLSLLFAEIFDPKHEGVVGPRWERWFSIFATASIALLGQAASFESIIALSQGKSTIEKLASAIQLRHPRSAQALNYEYVGNGSNDFNDLINYCVCKFQRMTTVPQLRNALGAGANALDFKHIIDSDTVTLVDLAVPVIGTNAARIVGTLLLLQVWNAALARNARHKTHIVAIDEAHLFQTNPLPQMLAEGRKFGIAMFLAHQHCGQLSREVRDALDANSASFSAFRLSVRDSVDTVNKFGDIKLCNDLCRLNAFSALSTLSVDGRQTDAFTLQVVKPEIYPFADTIAKDIEQRSLETLVTPYRSYRALTQEEVLARLDYYAENPLPPFRKDRNPSIQLLTTKTRLGRKNSQVSQRDF